MIFLLLFIGRVPDGLRNCVNKEYFQQQSTLPSLHPQPKVEPPAAQHPPTAPPHWDLANTIASQAAAAASIVAASVPSQTNGTIPAAAYRSYPHPPVSHSAAQEGGNNIPSLPPLHGTSVAHPARVSSASPVVHRQSPIVQVPGSIVTNKLSAGGGAGGDGATEPKQEWKHFGTYLL